MKIAVIAPTTIPSRRANTIQVMKMTQALVEGGHDTRLAAPGDQGQYVPDRPSWPALARQYGLQHEFPVSWLPANPSLKRYDYAWRGLRWAKSWGAEVIYTRLPQAAAIASLIGAATILEMHDQPHETMGPILLRAFLKGRGARRLVLISHSLAADLVKIVRDLPKAPFTTILPDGVDLERYRNLPEPEEARRILQPSLKAFASQAGSIFLSERFTAGYTGHLYTGRGIELILDLAGCLPEVNFLIVGGEPEDHRRLVESIGERGLVNLIPTGFIPNAELPLYQAACEVLLMPYQRRVAASSGGNIARYLSPMKAFEYLACGRVICSSDVPVLKEVLSDENSILLPPEDLSAWVAALTKVRTSPHLYASQAAAARRTAERYTWDERAKKIMGELY